jgi:hypothetical protein
MSEYVDWDELRTELRLPRGEFNIQKRNEDGEEYDVVQFRPHIDIAPSEVEALRDLFRAQLLATCAKIHEGEGQCECGECCADCPGTQGVCQCGNCRRPEFCWICEDCTGYLGSDQMVRDSVRRIATEAIRNLLPKSTD